MSLKPVNNHLLIEPLKHEAFIASDREVFEEIGIVVDYGDIFSSYSYTAGNVIPIVDKGDKVFFDSWCAAKYPKPEGGYYWLVKWEDIRAVEHAEIPTK